MSLIKFVEPENASGKLAEIYQKMSSGMGFIPNAFKLFSTSEHIINQQYTNLGYFIRHPKLSGKFLAFVRLLVSENVHCEYCVNVNTSILFQYGILPESINEIVKDLSKVPLEENEKQLLYFVLKVVKNSNSVTKEDIEQLYNLGWSDMDILDASYHGVSQVAMDMLLNAFKVDKD